MHQYYEMQPNMMFSETSTKFYANITSAWLSTSLTMIVIFNLGAYEMITASSLLFTALFVVGIYLNLYNLLLHLNTGMEMSHLKYLKYIPVFALCVYELVILRDLYAVLEDKNRLIEVLRIYNIDNYKIHDQVLDAAYAYDLMRNIGIVSYVVNLCFTGFIVRKLWNEERKLMNVIEGSRSTVTNVNATSYCNKELFKECLSMSMSKVSYVVIAPLTLFSVINLHVLPNILYTLFIERAKEIYILSWMDFGIILGLFVVHHFQVSNRGSSIFMKIMLLHIFIIGAYLYLCASKQYGVYEFIKVQDYALTYTGCYSIILNIYIYQVCNIHYLVNNDYRYTSIPATEIV
jgi:hypothetical protein